MALTVGTDTYITVADAKTQAAKISEEGIEFSNLSDADVEKWLTFALNEIEELHLTGCKKSSSNALEFPRTYFDSGKDPDGTTVAKKVQVYNAICYSTGVRRTLDKRIIDATTMAFDEVSVYQALASIEAYELLKLHGYIEVRSPSLTNQLVSSRNQNKVSDFL